MVFTYKEIDKHIDSLNDRFPFYNWLIPVNLNTELKRFKRNPLSYNPDFIYKYTNRGLDEAEKILSNIDPAPGAAKDLYIALKEEYYNKIELIRRIGKPLAFTEMSLSIFGWMDEADKQFSEDVLDTYSDDNYLENIPAEDIKNGLETMVAEKGIVGWQVILDDRIASKVTVKPTERTIYVRSDVDFFPSELERLKVHEVAVHLFRAANGEKQPYAIFKNGLAGYLEAEEGLAVYYENKMKVCNQQQMKIYAGRYKAVEQALYKSFAEVFRELKNWFPDEMALRLTFRAKRGMTDTSQPGALTKDIHYISGYKKVKKLMIDRTMANVFFCGKTGLNHIEKISRMLSDKLLREPKYKP